MQVKDLIVTGDMQVLGQIHECGTPLSTVLSNKYLSKSGDTMSGTLKINGTEVDDGSGQLAMLKALSTNKAGGGWIGRAMVGAKDLTFLMGTYNGLAGIGAHSWTDAAAGTGAAWAPMYFNPDGNSPMYFGADGVGWTANRGTLKVQGSTTAGGGEVAVSGKLTVNGNDILSVLSILSAKVSTLEAYILITFTIAGTTYYAMRGMTWREWIDSDYNTVGAYFTNDGRIVVPGQAMVATDYGSGYQTATDQIISGKAYVFSA